MKEKIKKYLLFLTILGVIFSITTTVLAHPGNTDSYGCHTCRTNCTQWGLSYGEYHCHQSKGLIQPLDPIRSHDEGYSEPWPDYSSPSIPSQPTCPLFSNYNSLSKSCECIYGYVVDNGSCVDGDIVCHRKHGYSSEYNSITNKCECSYGYVFNSSNQCISRDAFCQNLLGFNAEYKILEDTCGCRSGYILNSSQTECINGDNFCSNLYGIYSSYNSYLKKCECDPGYELDSVKGECIKKVYCPFNSSKIGNQCFCNDGYIMKNNQCITYTEDCIDEFGLNVRGEKGSGNNSTCYCNEGYEWNISQTACIKSVICPLNSKKINNICVCDVGYEWDSSNTVCLKVVAPQAKEESQGVTEKQINFPVVNEKTQQMKREEIQKNNITSVTSSASEEQKKDTNKVKQNNLVKYRPAFLANISNSITRISSLFKNLFNKKIK